MGYQINTDTIPKKNNIASSKEKRMISGTVSKIRDGDTIVLGNTPSNLIKTFLIKNFLIIITFNLPSILGLFGIVWVFEN